MGWQPLPRGIFTGVDWSSPHALDGADPYLAWAEADGFRGYRGVPRWLPIALELKEGHSIQELVAASSLRWLRVPRAYVSPAVPPGFRFCTAHVRRDFFKAISVGGRLRAMVKRVELGMPAHSHAEGIPERACAQPGHVAPRDRKSLRQPVVFGLIDDSLAVAHANFLDRRGAPRTAMLWRQDDQGQGTAPSRFGYGRELAAADIAAAIRRNTHNGMVDEQGAYIDLGLSTLGQQWPSGQTQFHALDLSVSHGTHVADIAAGPRPILETVANLPPGFDTPPSWAAPGDAASQCPLIAVQLDYATVADTSGSSLNVHILDGLVYILAHSAVDAKVVVNISFGSLAGPHDGTSLLEAAMDQLIGLRRDLHITIAAGNSYQKRTHANLTLGPGKAQTLHWRVQPDDRTQSFLEIWLPPDAGDLEVTLTPPGRPALPPVGLNQSGMWTDGGHLPLCSLIFGRRVALGDRGTCALIALAPTFSFDDEPTAPAGAWDVTLKNGGRQTVTLDAYVQRDDVVIGTATGARQSHFEDAQYDTSGNPGSFVDRPANRSAIRRSGTFNSIGTGSRTRSVGGIRINDGSWAWYSARFPDPDVTRPSRPNVVKVPDDRAYSDENAALVGLRAAGPRSGSVARLAGTSDAAPQVARKRLNGR